MDWAVIGRTLAAAVPVVVGALKWMGLADTSGGRRRDLQRDLDLRDRLPEDSKSRELLQAHIDRQVEIYVAEAQTEKRVDPTGIVLGLIFLAAGAAAVYRVLVADWSPSWLLVAGVLLLFGAVGTVQDAVPRERDERGRVKRKG